MIDMSRLNPPQREAVEHTEGPLLILAGAGSGKTRVLTHRMAYLIDRGVPAWQILAITFTNKAAREMQERALKLCPAASEAWVSTFHACCARMLRRDIEKLGYQRSFSIYDDDDQNAAIRGILKDMNLNEKMYAPRDVRAIISDAKNRLLTPKEWLREAGEGDFRNKKLYEIFETYQKKLKGNNALDFDDLLMKTIELLTNHPPVLQYYQNRFHYIMVDEYQDTNMAQYEMVRLLAGQRRNLCVVGDDDQSIYGWRGADIRNILEFEKDFPGCNVIKLEQNYRSTSNILDAANQVIAHNAGRKEKSLWTEAEPGEKIRLYYAGDERDEAAFIASRLSLLKKEGKPLGQCAVLYRTNAQSRVLEEALVRAGVPYRVYGGTKFYDRKEVKDLIAYLRAVVNPSDNVALRRIINEPRRGIGDTTIEQLELAAEQQGMPLSAVVMYPDDVGLNSRAKKSLEKFTELYERFMSSWEGMKPQDFLTMVIDETGYENQFTQVKSDENQARLENIAELKTAIADYAEREPEGGLAGFLENVALVTDMDNMDETQQVTTLMTLHAAKGLEFDYVFMAGMEESIFPTSRAMFDEEKLEEERRLCYVGITRARKQLYMTYAQNRALYGSRQVNERSRFIDEIPQRVREDFSPAGQVRRLEPPRESHGVASYGSFSGPKAPAAGRFGAPAAQVRPQPSFSGNQAGKAGLNIPGVAKGFSSFSGKSGAAENHTLFSPGDRVRHARFGEGVVTATGGEGRGAHITIRFADGAEKTFNADIAPVVKTT